MYSVAPITKESRSRGILVVIAGPGLLTVPARPVRPARPAYLARPVHLAVLALLPNHVDLADHVVLAIHLPQESRVVLVVLLILTVQTVQAVLDIPDLLEGRVVQGYHVLPLVQLDQLLLACPLVQLPLVVQDSLGLPVDLVVLGYLVLLVVQTVLPVPEVPLLIVVDGRSAFHAVLGCSKGQAAIEPPK